MRMQTHTLTYSQKSFIPTEYILMTDFYRGIEAGRRRQIGLNRFATQSMYVLMLLSNP